MADRSTRPVKRLRRLSTEDDDSEASDGWIPQKDKIGTLNMAPQTRASRKRLTSSALPRTSVNAPTPAAPGRTRRGAAVAASTTISRTSTHSPDETRPSIHLTVKAPPSKLKEVTTGSSSAATRRGAPRGSRTRKPMVEIDTDDDDKDELAGIDEEEAEDEDAEGEVDEDEIMVDAAAAADEDEDAEGEEVDTGSEVPTPVAPAEPAAAARGTRSQKPNIRLVPAEPVQLSSIESKEVAMGIHAVDDDDDDELSDIDDEEEEDAEGEAEEEDAEGEEDEDEVVKVAADDDDDELDSDGATPASGSRALTPDLSKLTRRQRAAFEDYDVGLLALSNEAQKKKVFTAEETAMRRAEMARRRKNLSEKRNEEEKLDTINRLLKKQAPKRRGRAMAEVTEAGEEDAEQKASPLFARWVNNAQGSRVAVPDEWLGKTVGRVFDASVAPRPYQHVMRRMVEEID